MTKIDSILLGDNPLFGIDHLSQERARERSYSLHGLDGITKVINFSVQLGARGFVVSTHSILPDLIEHLRKQTNVLESLNFYPIIPYVQAYVTKVTEKGVMGALSDILTGGSILNTAQIISRGTMGIVKKDFEELFRLFIDIELRPLNNVKTKVVFLHDVITDVALGLNTKDIIEIFISQIKDRHNLEAGLVTKNFPRLVKALNNWNIPIPPIMTSFNKVGAQMNPNRESCELTLKEINTDIIAMNTLAGGYLKPKDAFEYIFNLSRIRSVVVGLSSEMHARETLGLLTDHFKD